MKSTGSVFVNNRTQAVRLPVEVRFPSHIKKVSVRISGQDRILSPIKKTWDSFFLSDQKVSEDFMLKRPAQTESRREDF